MNDHCHVDLAEHRVFRVADEGLELERLLDQPEEYLNLPSFFVNFRDGLGRQAHMAGQENVVFSGLAITVAHAA